MAIRPVRLTLVCIGISIVLGGCVAYPPVSNSKNFDSAYQSTMDSGRQGNVSRATDSEILLYPKPSPDAPSVDNDPRTRRNDDGSLKITDGVPVKGSNFGDTVGIASANSAKVSCTGTLIAPDMVLTAAHCTCLKILGNVYFGNDEQSWMTSVKVKKFAEGFKTDSSDCNKGLKEGRDLAILQLERPVTEIKPRHIASDTLVDKATSYRAVGFGAIDRNAKENPRQKREARIFATSNGCSGSVSNLGKRSDEDVYGCLPRDEIVAGRRKSTDTCLGDSGGPLLVSPVGTGYSQSTNSYLLAGVTSRASSISETICGDGGIYERLNTDARAWINKTIQALRNEN